jgi:hypothetical protein
MASREPDPELLRDGRRIGVASARRETLVVTPDSMFAVHCDLVWLAQEGANVRLGQTGMNALDVGHIERPALERSPWAQAHACGSAYEKR